MAYIYFDA